MSAGRKPGGCKLLRNGVLIWTSSARRLPGQRRDRRRLGAVLSHEHDLQRETPLEALAKKPSIPVEQDASGHGRSPAG